MVQKGTMRIVTDHLSALDMFRGPLSQKPTRAERPTPFIGPGGIKSSRSLRCTPICQRHSDFASAGRSKNPSSRPGAYQSGGAVSRTGPPESGVSAWSGRGGSCRRSSRGCRRGAGRERRAGQALGTEHAGPVVERQVAGDDGRTALVALENTSNSSSAPVCDSGTLPSSSLA